MPNGRKKESIDQLVLPTFCAPVTRVPGVRPGEWIVKVGAPEVMPEEITTAQFAEESGLSQDHVAQLCFDGLIKCRRKSPREKSSYLIPRSELDRFKTADPHEFSTIPTKGQNT